MSVGSINKCKAYHPDLLFFSKRGDYILSCALQGLVDQGDITRKMRNRLLTNKRLKSFKRPFKLRMECRWTNKNRVKSFYGDQVEAYIYFLEINYGREAVKRYILRNIKVFNEL